MRFRHRTREDQAASASIDLIAMSPTHVPISLSEKNDDELARLFLTRSQTAWVSNFIPPVKGVLRARSKDAAICHLRMTEQSHVRSADRSQASLSNVSRRRILQTLLSCSGLVLYPGMPAVAFDNQMEKFTSKSLHLSVEYPKEWFRSERGGTLVLLNLKTVIAATLSVKAVKLKPLPDPFSAAFDMVRDRIEREGAEILIKEAAFDPDGALVFRFEASTLMPDGSSVVRFGLSRCIPSLDGRSAVACIVTYPKESVDELQPQAERIMRSVQLV